MDQVSIRLAMVFFKEEEVHPAREIEYEIFPTFFSA